MSSFSSVTILGKITRPPELKHTPNGAPYARFSISTTDAHKKNNQWEYHNNYFEVECWGDTAERVADQIIKDMLVILSGTLKYETWESDGGKKSMVRVVASTVKEVRMPKPREQRDDQPSKPNKYSKPSRPTTRLDDDPF